MAYEPLTAGALDKKVEIQAPTSSDDGGGGQDTNWTRVGMAWASIEPGSGREFAAAQQLQPTLSHMIGMRYRTDVSPHDRLVYRTSSAPRTFLVHAVANASEQDEQLLLFCSEIQQ